MAEINKKSLGEGVITFAHPYTFAVSYTHLTLPTILRV